MAWAKTTLAGEDAFVDSMAIVPSNVGNYYDKYFVVSRTINGETKKYIEWAAQTSDDPNYWQYMDCALEYHDDETAISTATGLDHLEGGNCRHRC